jgi:uncharacterized membrane protein YidH (DUF202 family)
MILSRKMLLTAIAGLGVFLIAYGLIRYFTGFEPGESVDKYLTDIIIMIALGLFIYSRKMAKDEKQAREAADESAEESVEETVIDEDNGKPHWEQNKETTDQEDV